MVLHRAHLAGVARVADGIAVFEALLTAGILFVIAGFLHEQKHESGRRLMVGTLDGRDGIATQDRRLVAEADSTVSRT